MSKIEQMARDIAERSAGVVATQAVQTVVAAAVPVSPDTGKVLSPIDQMNKPVKGTQANLAAGSVTVAVLYLISKAGWMPAGWQDPDAQYALALLLPWGVGMIANFIASYKARDKRFALTIDHQ